MDTERDLAPKRKRRLAVLLGVSVVLLEIAHRLTMLYHELHPETGNPEALMLESFYLDALRFFIVLPLAYGVERWLGRKKGAFIGMFFFAAGFVIGGVLGLYNWGIPLLGHWFWAIGMGLFLPAGIATFSNVVSKRFRQRDAGFAIAVVLWLFGLICAEVAATLVRMSIGTTDVLPYFLALLIGLLGLGFLLLKTPDSTFEDTGTLALSPLKLSRLLSYAASFLFLTPVFWVGLMLCNHLLNPFMHIHTFYAMVLAAAFIVWWTVKAKPRANMAPMTIGIPLLCIGHLMVGMDTVDLAVANNIAGVGTGEGLLGLGGNLLALVLAVAVGIVGMFYLKQYSFGEVVPLLRIGGSTAMLMGLNWYWRQPQSFQLPAWIAYFAFGAALVLGIPTLFYLLWKKGPPGLKLVTLGFFFVAELLASQVLKTEVPASVETINIWASARPYLGGGCLLIVVGLLAWELKKQSKQ